MAFPTYLQTRWTKAWVPRFSGLEVHNGDNSYPPYLIFILSKHWLPLPYKGQTKERIPLYEPDVYAKVCPMRVDCGCNQAFPFFCNGLEEGVVLSELGVPKLDQELGLWPPLSFWVKVYQDVQNTIETLFWRHLTQRYPLKTLNNYPWHSILGGATIWSPWRVKPLRSNIDIFEN